MAEDPAPASNESPVQSQAGEPQIDSSQIESPPGAVPPDDPPQDAAASAGDAAISAVDAAASAADAVAAAADADSPFDQAAIDELLKQANFEDPSNVPADQTGGPALPDASSFELPNFQQAMQDAQVSSIDLLRDVELNVKIELGRSRML